MNRIKTSIFDLGREDYRRGEARPNHYPERAAGWDFALRHTPNGPVVRGYSVAEEADRKGAPPLAPRYETHPSTSTKGWWMVVDTKTHHAVAFRKSAEEARAVAEARNAQ